MREVSEDENYENLRHKRSRQSGLARSENVAVSPEKPIVRFTQINNSNII